MRRALVLLCALVASAPGLALAQDLAPPPPMDPNAPNGQVPAEQTNPQNEQQSQTLQRQETEDSGRGLEWVWLNAEAGASYINMSQFNENSLAIEKSSSGGPMFGLGAGIRILVFTLGVRARLHQMNAFNIWQVLGEAGFHIPIGMLDPYIAVHGGYAFMGTLSSDSLNSATSLSSGDVSVHGLTAGLSVGGDYYFSHLFSLGLDLTGDLLFLKRPPVAIPSGLPPAQQAALQGQPLYANSGDSVGFGLSGSLHAGLHF